MAGISVHPRTNKVPLRTLDVRQILRKILGKRKPPGMKSNAFSIHRLCQKSKLK
jgi:hypothetical protein